MANWLFNLLHGKMPGTGFLGRSSAGSGPAELLNPAAARALLDISFYNDISGLRIKNNTVNPDYQLDINISRAVINGVDEGPQTLTVDLIVSGAGGLDTGSAAPDTYYFVWLIYDPDTPAVSAVLSASATSPTLPNGYSDKIFLGFWPSDTSGNLIRMYQMADEVWFSAKQTIATDLSDTLWTTQSLAGVIPTGAGIIKTVLLGGSSTSNIYVQLSDDGVNLKTIFVTGSTLTGAGERNEHYDVRYAAPDWIPVDGDNIYYKQNSGTATTLHIRAVRIFL